MINILYTNRRWETFSIGILGTSFHSYFCCIIAILLWVICWVILEGFVFLFLRLYYVLSVFSIFMYVIYISRKIRLDNSFKKYFILFAYLFLSTPCGMWDLSLSPGIEPTSLHWKPGVLTTGWPGKNAFRWFLKCFLGIARILRF